eukprot:gene8250-1519_t
MLPSWDLNYDENKEDTEFPAALKRLEDLVKSQGGAGGFRAHGIEAETIVVSEEVVESQSQEWHDDESTSASAAMGLEETEFPSGGDLLQGKAMRTAAMGKPYAEFPKRVTSCQGKL